MTRSVGTNDGKVAQKKSSVELGARQDTPVLSMPDLRRRRRSDSWCCEVGEEEGLAVV